MEDHAEDAAIRQLLDQAHRAIAATNAQQALQYVVKALALIRGDNAVMPALRHAAEQYHLQQHAPVDEISALLAQVTLQIDEQHPHQDSSYAPLQQQQQQIQQQQQQQQQHWPSQLWTQQHQLQLPHYMSPDAGAAAAAAAQHPHLLQRSHQPINQPHSVNTSILDESGRGEFSDLALADGSSWQCPRCHGVVLLQRQEAHLQHWCPALPGTQSSE